MNKEKALSLAAAICSKKEHCSWEIQEKLVKWEIPEKEIDRILAAQPGTSVENMIKQALKSL
jgi:SOS response regulatory protein OraA/RecX